MGFLSYVGVLVFREVGIVCEPFATDSAAKRFLLVVAALVYRKDGWRSACLVAEITNTTFTFDVDFPVVCEFDFP